ncbi:hypothetical protein OPV22_011659 [Ensete ventricosum]|uniref:Plant heme peroxidase family profile domain-containing protein n=1 Tax=Ensete ventricosum TaxID=4639 RepID=A0AAV8RNS3_ENSVE|nr:hypothetical protein OPV22_011659 [Ensete ventricosum]
MAASPALSSVLLLLLSGIAFFSASSRAYEYPPIVSGLSFDFYKSACPNVEPLVRNFLSQLFKKDIGLAAALLRVHFHDCFVQGCDGSILLDGSAGGPSEKNAPPNLTLRPAAFKAINDLQKLVTKACGQVVSCADISALAARDSVLLSGGPDYMCDELVLQARSSIAFLRVSLGFRARFISSVPPNPTPATVRRARGSGNILHRLPQGLSRVSRLPRAGSPTGRNGPSQSICWATSVRTTCYPASFVVQERR